MKPILLGAAIALAMATSAKATPFEVTYTGTVSDDADNDLLASGQSATGDVFTETFVVDPGTPGASTYNSPGYNYTEGGTPSDPVTSFTITIAGQSFTASNFSSHGEDLEKGYAFADYNEAYDFLDANDVSGGYVYASTVIDHLGGTTSIVPTTYGGSGSYMVQPGDTSYGYLGIGNGSTGASDDLKLSPTEVIFSGSAVPEPATWALMLVGFGFVGTAMRRPTVAASLKYG